jgi:signal transduction histidine kinase
MMLVGSVVFPAGESQRVLALVDEDESVIEPLRLLSSQLGSGIADEAAELQRLGMSGDSAAFARYQRVRSRNEASTASMRELSVRAGGDIADEADSLRRLVIRWRLGVGRESVRDSIELSIARLESGLGERSAERRAAVSVHERRGVVINAMQVLVALGALAALCEVLRRERRRAEREAALRQCAESLACAFDKQDVAQQVANGVMALLSAASVSVTHIENPADPDVERWIRNGKPFLMAAGSATGAAPRKQRAMVIPLGTPDVPIGAVIAFESGRARFHRDDLAWSGIFGHLASFAYEKARLLDDARAGQASLQRVLESRGRLMRGFSHDVKNPLGAADGYAALLQDGIYGSVTAEQVSSITRVREAIHRALSLIEDLHELARAETGHLELHRERVNIAQLVLVTAEEYRATATAKRLGFVVEVAAALPRVDTDPSRLRQIIGNLLSNAIKYTDSGVVTLRARCDASDSPNEAAHLLIEVQDTGPGIPLDKQGFIFDEFARLADGRHAGAGVGLAISKHVADALGCRLEVTSTVGKGSTFTLCIPMHTHAREPELELEQTPSASWSAS